MPIVPIAPPVPLRVVGPIAAVAVDADRRRIFAAGARSIAMIDADSGTLLATIRIGGLRSIALEPLGGHVFVGTADGHVSEVDPDRKSIVRTADTGTPAVDVLVYDSATGRLYLDGGGSPALTVLDARTFKGAGSVVFPGSKPGRIVTDPVTRDLYVAQSLPAIAVVDTKRLAVRLSFATPGLGGNAVLSFDDTLGQLVAVGANGVLDVYDRAGTQRARIAVPAEQTGCDIDTASHQVGCTGPQGLTMVQLVREAQPSISGTAKLNAPGFAALDAKTRNVLSVGSQPDGSKTDFQRFRPGDGRDTLPIP